MPEPRAGISAIGYAFAAESRSVRELAGAGSLTSEPEVLESFGFGRVHVAVAECAYDLALRAAGDLLASHEIDPASIGMLLYGGTPATAFTGGGRLADASSLGTTERFRYPATRLQFDLGLVNASVLGLDSLACTTLFGAVRLAAALCEAEGIDRILCVSAELFPCDAGREAIFNCTSDAGCAVLVERECARNRIAGSAHVTKGYYWDCEAMRDEIVASYFPTSRHCVDRVMAAAGWTAADVDWVIPHNVSLRSWRILLALLRLPRARLWSDNIALRGHTLAGDTFINLADAIDSGAVKPGEKLLLFSFGYGAHWTALALEA